MRRYFLFLQFFFQIFICFIFNEFNSMKAGLIYTFLLVVSFITIIKSQWYIIKKDYPSILMNYPNPGKRSLSKTNPIGFFRFLFTKERFPLDTVGKKDSIDSHLIEHEKRQRKTLPIHRRTKSTISETWKNL